MRCPPFIVDSIQKANGSKVCLLLPWNLCQPYHQKMHTKSKSSFFSSDFTQNWRPNKKQGCFVITNTLDLTAYQCFTQYIYTPISVKFHLSSISLYPFLQVRYRIFYCPILDWESVFYNQLLAMILSIVFLVVAAWAQSSLLPIRTGISKLHMGNLNQASFHISYNTSLPDAVYSSLVSVSYVQNFNTANGINVSSICLTTTATGMDCTIISGNPNQYNVVYISYVVSGIGSLLVGTYTKTFSFEAVTTITQNLVFKPNVDSNFINRTNSLYVQLYPFVAGIGSVDSDFSLNIDSSNFDAISLNISLGVTLKEVNVKDVTVVFGYMLFDSSVITISLYEGQSLIPGNIPQGFVYGIKTVKTAPPKRLLQSASLDISKFVDPFKQFLKPSKLPILNKVISAFDVFNIFPEVQNSTKNNKQVAGEQSDIYTPLKSSYALQLLRSGRISQLRFKNVYLNPTIFSLVAQIGGINDTNSSILDPLKNKSLYSPKSTVSRRVHHSHQITPKAAPSDVAPPPLDDPIVVQLATGATTTDNNMFNNLFTSIGFVIITSSTDIDQIYYYGVDFVQNIPSPKAASTPVFIRSTVTNQQPTTTCKSGETKVGKQTQIDFIQKKMVVSCIACPAGSSLDPITKNCVVKPLSPAPAPLIAPELSKAPAPTTPPAPTARSVPNIVSSVFHLAAPSTTSKGNVSV